jgi:hypothetical protein
MKCNDCLSGFCLTIKMRLFQFLKIAAGVINRNVNLYLYLKLS